MGQGKNAIARRKFEHKDSLQCNSPREEYKENRKNIRYHLHSLIIILIFVGNISI